MSSGAHASVCGCFQVNFSVSTRRLCPSRLHMEIWTIFHEHFVWRFGVEGGGVLPYFTAFFGLLLTELSPRRSADFFGALEDQLFVGCRGLPLPISRDALSTGIASR